MSKYSHITCHTRVANLIHNKETRISDGTKAVRNIDLGIESGLQGNGSWKTAIFLWLKEFPKEIISMPISIPQPITKNHVTEGCSNNAF